MEKNDGATAKDRIAKNAVRISKLKKHGRDTSQLEVILKKIETAHRSGNVKEKNLLEAISKLEGLLQVTEKLNAKSSSPDGDKKVAKPSKDRKKPSKDVKETSAPHDADMGSDNEVLEGLQREVSSFGGDLSPIFHHLEALGKARQTGDRETFRRYSEVVKPWLHEYLFNLKKSRVNERLREIRSRIDELEKWGRMDLVGPLKGELDPLVPLAERAGDDIDMVLIDLDKLSEMASGAAIQLDGDLRGRVLSKQKDLKDIMFAAGEGVDTSAAEEDLKRSSEMMDEGRMEEALEILEARLQSFMLIVNREQVEQRDRYLKLLEPLFAKVLEVRGAGSDTYKGLLEKKSGVEQMPLARIDEALKQLERLLDEAAKASAEAEEGVIRSMRNRIAEMESEINDMDRGLTSKISGLLKAINESLIDADLNGSARSLKEAEAEFDLLIQRKNRSNMEVEIRKMRENLNTLRSRGASVMPIEEVLASAQEHLMRNDISTAQIRLSKARDMFTGLLEVTLKADYELLGARIRAEIDSPESAPIPRETMLERLDNSKLLFEAGDIAEAVTILRETEGQIKSEKLSCVIDRKIEELVELIREATAFGLDAREMAENVKDARELNEKGDLEGALEIASASKVRLEAMIRERNLRKMESDIESIVLELRRLNAAPEDHRETVARSYSLLEAGKINEAVQGLSELKASLLKKLDTRRIEVMMDTMAVRIREARAYDLDMSSYKAALTKAGVRYEVGDLEGAMSDLVSNLESLEQIITERKLSRSRMDKLRGSMISLQGKLQRLSQRNVDVSHFKEDMKKLKDLIEARDEASSRELSDRLDGEITRLFRMVPVESISETNRAPSRISHGPGHPSIEINSIGSPELEKIDPAEARKRLQLLLTRIGRAVQMRGGIDVQEESKAELEGIKALIIEKRYSEAYSIALRCMKRLGG